MSRIIFGKIANASNTTISFALMKSSIVVGSTPLLAHTSADGKFALVVPAGKYSVSINKEDGVQGIGIANVTDGDIPIDIADALNGGDGGSRDTNGNTTLYLLPRTLDAVVPPIKEVDMASQRLVNLQEPIEPQDASTKYYVDNNIEKVRGYTFVPRVVQTIEKECVNLTQLIDKYKTLTQDTLVAIEHADTIFPEQQLELGRGALYMIKPIITQGVTTLEFTFTVGYYENMILHILDSNTVCKREGSEWVDISLINQNRILEAVYNSELWSYLEKRLANIEALVIPLAEEVIKVSSDDVKEELAVHAEAISTFLENLLELQARVTENENKLDSLEEVTEEMGVTMTKSIENIIDTISEE